VTAASTNKAEGQARERTIRGVVRDTIGAPLPQAWVELMGSTRAAFTDRQGAFSLQIPAGFQYVRTSRIGYWPDTAGIAQDSAALVIVLRSATLRLAGISVRADAAPPLSHTLTRRTVQQVPPLGEPDIFRAAVFVPGASQPNDLKGRIHLAGGRSDETAIALDGHPLQDPFHILGILGAFNVAALDRADVLMHHVPVSMHHGLSGAIALESRRVGSAAEREVVVSLLSSSVTITQPITGRTDLLASGRITYLDKLVALVADDARIGGDEVPLLGFADAVLRFGFSDGGLRAEVLGFHSEDAIGVSDAARSSGRRPLGWSESLAGARLTRTTSRTAMRAQVSANRHQTSMNGAGVSLDLIDSHRNWLTSQVDLTLHPGVLSLTASGALFRRVYASSWNIGRQAKQVFSPHTPTEFADTAAHTESQLGASVERTFVGGRVAAGTRLAVVGSVRRVLPFFTASRVVGKTRFETSWQRRSQFTVELEEPIEGNVAPPQFLLRRPRMASVTAASVERIICPASDGSLRFDAFSKRYQDHISLTDSGAFPAFIAGRASAVGASLAWRCTWRGIFLHAAYTWQRSRESIGGAWYATVWDVPNDITCFANVPITADWTLTASYRAHSGRPATPVEARVFVPYPEFGGTLSGRFLSGTRHGVRVPAYHRLDIGARKTWRRAGTELTLFAQVINVFNRRNPLDYGEATFTDLGDGRSRIRPTRGSLPVLPTIGMEARW
jgi:hypothetical protein